MNIQFRNCDDTLARWRDCNSVPRIGDQIVFRYGKSPGIYQIDNVRWLKQDSILVFVSWITTI